MKYYLLVFCLFFSITTYGQANKSINYKIPKRYKIYDGNFGEVVKCEDDFDNDKIKDLAILCSNFDDTQGVVIVFLSTCYSNDKVYFWFPWDLGMYHKFEYNSNTLILSRFVGFGSNYTVYFKFKYFETLRDMRLVNYSSELNFKNMQNIDLCSGKFEVNGKTGYSKFDIISLANVEKYLDYLQIFDGTK